MISVILVWISVVILQTRVTSRCREIEFPGLFHFFDGIEIRVICYSRLHGIRVSKTISTFLIVLELGISVFLIWISVVIRQTRV